MKKSAVTLGMKQGLVSGLIAVIFTWLFPFLLPVFLSLLIFSLIGAYYGIWYMRKGKVNKSWLHNLFWSNAVSWIIPPVGFFTCSATHYINYFNHGEDRETFITLRRMSYLLSLINAIVLAKFVL